MNVEVMEVDKITESVRSLRTGGPRMGSLGKSLHLRGGQGFLAGFRW